jgi:hypothetical protein
VKVVERINRSYRCDVCGSMLPGYMLAEGPGPVHICQNCIGLANERLSQDSPDDCDKSGGS